MTTVVVKPKTLVNYFILLFQFIHFHFQSIYLFQQSYMTGKMSSLPDQHIKQSKLVLTEYLKLGDQPANRQMDAFRVSLKSIQPIVTNAHWLSPPDMKFANNQLYSLNPTRGVRFQTNGKFVMPARVKSVTIINYDKEFNRNVE